MEVLAVVVMAYFEETKSVVWNGLSCITFSMQVVNGRWSLEEWWRLWWLMSFFYGDEEVVKRNVKVEVRRWWNENNEKERRSIPLLLSVSISTWKYLSST